MHEAGCMLESSVQHLNYRRGDHRKVELTRAQSKGSSARQIRSRSTSAGDCLRFKCSKDVVHSHAAVDKQGHLADGTAAG